MDNETLMWLLIRFSVYIIAFLLLVGIVKFGMKRHLNYGRVVLVGFIVGFMFFIVWVATAHIFYPDSEAVQLYLNRPEFLFDSAISEGIIALAFFIVLYAIYGFLYKNEKYERFYYKYKKRINRGEEPESASADAPYGFTEWLKKENDKMNNHL